MVTRVRIIGLMGEPSPFDGKWLAEYDPGRQGWSPDGRPMIAHIKAVEDPKDALVFSDAVEAWKYCWRTDGIRPDGRPNRPITAFTLDLINE